jgi:hypothetical protein
MAVSLIGGGNRSIHLSQVTDKLYHIMVYTSLWSRFELTTSVVLGTDCIGSCKFELTTSVVIGTDCIGSCKFKLPYDHGHDGPLFYKNEINRDAIWFISDPNRPPGPSEDRGNEDHDRLIYTEDEKISLELELFSG